MVVLAMAGADGEAGTGADSQATVGFAIWGSTCLLALAVVILYPERRHRGFVRRAYAVYLLCQAVASALTIAEAEATPPTDSTAPLADGPAPLTWLRLAFWQLLLAAACVYVSIGVTVGAAIFRPTHMPPRAAAIGVPNQGEDEGISASTPMVPATQPHGPQLYADEGHSPLSRKQLTVIRWGLGAGFAVAVALSGGLVAMQVLGKAVLMPLMVFCFYLPAAILTCVCVLRVWWAGWPGLPPTDGLIVRRLAVVAAIMGMVDYLLPAIVYLGLPVWQPTLLSRGLDSLLYVPLVLPWILWVDRQQPVCRFRLLRLFK